MRTPLLGLWPKWSASDETLLGVHIPAGTCVCMNTSALLRSPKLFGDDADVYNPDRFMCLDDKARMEMEHNVELAFGSGQWMCVGKSIALMEINKIIFEVSSLIQRKRLSTSFFRHFANLGTFIDSYYETSTYKWPIR